MFQNSLQIEDGCTIGRTRCSMATKTETTGIEPSPRGQHTSRRNGYGRDSVGALRHSRVEHTRQASSRCPQHCALLTLHWPHLPCSPRWSHLIKLRKVSNETSSICLVPSMSDLGWKGTLTERKTSQKTLVCLISHHWSLPAVRDADHPSM